MSTETTTASRLATLKAQAAKSYAQKDYSAASDFYAQACELQSSINGDDNPLNAHLLYLYGRSLFQVALTKSDVLGGKPAEEQDGKEKEKKDGKGKGKGKDVSKIEEEDEEKKPKMLAPPAGAKAGFFSFTGDENWDDSDEEEGEGADDEEEDGYGEKDGDDFTLAWEILDFARVLFLKQLESSTSSSGEAAGGDTKPTDAPATPPTDETKPTIEETTTSTSSTSSTDPTTSIPNPSSASTSSTTTTDPPLDPKSLQTALADTYDLLGEVSLESESFPQATKDLRSSLDLKLQLYPTHSTLISEAHFKLSLALEFAAAGESVSDSDRRAGRAEAAAQMELAIASCRARIAKEEKELKELGPDGDVDGKAKKSLEDAKEMVAELEVRLADLRAETPPRVLQDGGEEEEELRGVLGQVLGEDPEDAKRRIAEAVGKANDLSGLVRKKNATSTLVVPANGGGGKRKLEGVLEEEEEEVPKKAKLQDEDGASSEAPAEAAEEKAEAEVKP